MVWGYIPCLAKVPAKHELGFKSKVFCNCMFEPIRGGTLPIFMYYLINIHTLRINLCVVFMYLYTSIHIGTLSGQSVSYHYTAGGGMGQGLATEVTLLRKNQPPVFPVLA